MDTAKSRVIRMALRQALATSDTVKRASLLETAKIASGVPSWVPGSTFINPFLGARDKAMRKPAPEPSAMGPRRLTGDALNSDLRFDKYAPQERQQMYSQLQANDSLFDLHRQRQANGGRDVYGNYQPRQAAEGMFDVTNLSHAQTRQYMQRLREQYPEIDSYEPTVAPNPYLGRSNATLEPIPQGGSIDDPLRTPVAPPVRSILENADGTLVYPPEADQPPAQPPAQPPQKPELSAENWDQEAYNDLRNRYRTLTRERRSLLKSKIKALRGEMRQLGGGGKGRKSVFAERSPYMPPSVPEPKGELPSV